MCDYQETKCDVESDCRAFDEQFYSNQYERRLVDAFVITKDNTAKAWHYVSGFKQETPLASGSAAAACRDCIAARGNCLHLCLCRMAAALPLLLHRSNALLSQLANLHETHDSTDEWQLSFFCNV
jgi:hypothetical protein